MFRVCPARDAAAVWLALSLCVFGQGPPAAPGAEDDLLPMPRGIETITRGPMHEGFAEPLSDALTISPVRVAVAPPRPINEQPPARQQLADSPAVSWLPGYWGIETIDQSGPQWCWVSGTHRRSPPGRRWDPGRWELTGGEHQWSPGVWMATDAAVQYLPPPPTMPRETIPPAPSPNHFWVPGQAIWKDGQYRWRPGYHARAQQDWVWVPAHYVPRPRGYVYVSGYWDYRLEDRGVLYAPVRVDPTYQITEIYIPMLPVNPQAALVNLFVQPGYCHYYYGDYYQTSPAWSPQPWSAYRGGPNAFGPGYGYQSGIYDPLAVYYGTTQPNRLGQLVGLRRGLVANPGLRPTLLAGNRRSDLIRTGLLIGGTALLIDAITDDDDDRDRRRRDRRDEERKPTGGQVGGPVDADGSVAVDVPGADGSTDAGADASTAAGAGAGASVNPLAAYQKLLDDVAQQQLGQSIDQLAAPVTDLPSPSATTSVDPVQTDARTSTAAGVTPPGQSVGVDEQRPTLSPAMPEVGRPEADDPIVSASPQSTDAPTARPLSGVASANPAAPAPNVPTSDPVAAGAPAGVSTDSPPSSPVGQPEITPPAVRSIAPGSLVPATPGAPAGVPDRVQTPTIGSPGVPPGNFNPSAGLPIGEASPIAGNPPIGERVQTPNIRGFDSRFAPPPSPQTSPLRDFPGDALPPGIENPIQPSPPTGPAAGGFPGRGRFGNPAPGGGRFAKPAAAPTAPTAAPPRAATPAAPSIAVPNLDGGQGAAAAGEASQNSIP